MNLSSPFPEVASRIASAQSWQYEAGTNRHVADVSGATDRSLQRPRDFPPLAAAIVPGDRVALAVDPNIPQIAEVIGGVMREIQRGQAAATDIVLWDEASDEVLELLSERFDGIAEVWRHDSVHRESLRYLGVDVHSEPIYLNRKLVDADLVLPIVAARPWDAAGQNELSGVYPMLADSNTRIRHRKLTEKSKRSQRSTNESQVGWMLGVQVMLAVAANDEGKAGAVFAGTPDAIRRDYDLSRHADDSFPPPAPLVICSVEGSSQQQSWANIARAIAAASTHTEPDGTIVVWSELRTPPSDRLVQILNAQVSHGDDNADAIFRQFEEIESESKTEDGFLTWDASLEIAKTLTRVASQYRVLLRSHLEAELVESLGIGAVDSVDDIDRLSKAFHACGTLRAAQFASGTFDSFAAIRSSQQTESR